MAANYWASTQRRHWQYTRQSLSQIRDGLEEEEKDLIQQYPLPDRRLLCQFFLHRPAPLLTDVEHLSNNSLRAYEVG